MILRTKSRDHVIMCSQKRWQAKQNVRDTLSENVRDTLTEFSYIPI